MLGLKRHTVMLAPYDSSWSEAAQESIVQLRVALGDHVIDIQHVGSTAVPGLPSKPVLDIAVLVPSCELVPILTEQLGKRGWIYLDSAPHEVGHMYVLEVEPQVRSHHLHLVERGDDRWDRYLRFRDALRQDVALRDTYARLKQELASAHAANRKLYTKGKDAFIQEVLGSRS